MNIGLAIDKKNGIKSEVVGIGKSGAKETHTNSLNLVNNPFGGEYEIKEAQNQWNGWGTCLKPSFEPIIVARKPLEDTCVNNVLKWGVGGINIDECRVGTEERTYKGMSSHKPDGAATFRDDNWKPKDIEVTVNGRFPANTILTYNDKNYDEVCGGFPETKKNGSISKPYKINNQVYGDYGYCKEWNAYNDSGSASRYFYCAKASKKDRNDGLENKNNTHPTVKPTSLMQYLVRLVTPKGGTILDPFMRQRKYRQSGCI